jgi:hypothetical protein
MTPKEQKYFKRMSNYENKGISEDYQLYINESAVNIRNTAKYVLSGNMLPSKAKKDISGLLKKIKTLEKMEKK